MSGELQGCRVMVPESRELDLFARMLERQGAETLRCPLVAILDAPDQAPIAAWLDRFIGRPCDDLILLTGEGLRRLHAAAVRLSLAPAFVAALSGVRTCVRGPKPAKALRELGLEAGLKAAEPTTDGVIATLGELDLRGRRVGVQLYPDPPDDRLLAYLASAGAQADPVLPYVYADRADEAQVLALVDRIAAGTVDAVAFTSSPQVRRLFEVARRADRAQALKAGLDRLLVAAVGPVVAAELARHEVRVAVEPEDSFFMKPLVSALAEAVAAGGKPS